MTGGILRSAVRLLSVTGVLLGLTCATALDAYAAPTWLAPQTVSAPTAAPVGIEPAMAMGANGTIAAASWSEGGRIVADVRPAGATSFAQEAVSTSGDGVVWPSVAVSASGAVAVAWLDETAGQYEVAIRLPSGTFSAPIEAGPTGGALPQRTSVAIDDLGDVLVGEFEERSGGNGVAAYGWIPAGGSPSATAISKPGDEASLPVVALDGAGDAIVAWYDKNGGPRDIARAITRPAGGAFGSVRNLTDSSEYAFALSAAIGEGGQAAVAWQRGNPTPPYHVEASTSAGPGDLLSVPQTISPAGGNDESPAIAVGGDGEAVAAWEQMGTTDTEDVASAPAGGAFGAPAEASANGDFGTPSIAADAAGDAVLTWGSIVGGLELVEAVTRTAAGTLAPAVTLSAPEEKVDYLFSHGKPAASAGMDGPGDAFVGWEHAADHTSQARIYDATGPALSVAVAPRAANSQQVSLSATASDLFSTVTSVKWSFGDGTGGEGSSVSHIYAKQGTYTITVTATDAVGNSTSASRQIAIVPSVACADAAVRVAACPSLPSECGPLRPCPAQRCVVPRLRGLSRHAANVRLRAVHCKLGRVTVLKRYRHSRRLVVAAQSPKPGTGRAYGASVAITLKPSHGRHRGGHAR